MHVVISDLNSSKNQSWESVLHELLSCLEQTQANSAWNFYIEETKALEPEWNLVQEGLTSRTWGKRGDFHYLIVIFILLYDIVQS